MLNGIAHLFRNVLAKSAACVLFLAALAACTGPDGAEASPPPRGGPLAAFHTALDRASRPGATRLAVLQLGDSHTANDAFSGRLRELLQARAGDGGRGMLPPGIPHDWYRPARVAVTSEGFRILRTTPTGLAALRQHADGPATMTLAAEPGELEHVSLELLTQPGGGTIDVTTSDGRTATLPTTPTSSRQPPLPTTPATSWVQLTARGDGPVDLLSWTALRGQAGATWSNLGTVGATMDLTRRWDPTLTTAEARALHPALIVLAFGTNEAFKDSTDLDAYPALVRTALRRLRAAAPQASLVVAGPPAGLRPARAGGTACPGTDYAVPPNLPRIRAILRRAAATEGAAFWDWADAMGGDCAILAWSRTEPPMAARDHVHLLVPGARATAEAFFAFLTR